MGSCMSFKCTFRIVLLLVRGGGGCPPNRSPPSVPFAAASASGEISLLYEGCAFEIRCEMGEVKHFAFTTPWTSSLHLLQEILLTVVFDRYFFPEETVFSQFAHLHSDAPHGFGIPKCWMKAHLESGFMMGRGSPPLCLPPTQFLDLPSFHPNFRQNQDAPGFYLYFGMNIPIHWNAHIDINTEGTKHPFSATWEFPIH